MTHPLLFRTSHAARAPHGRRPGRRAGRAFGLAVSLVPLLSLTFASRARAQDPEPLAIKPNVLLVVDTSGSMEYELGGNDFPACYSTDPSHDTANPAQHTKSRWINLVEVLTGTITNYACQRLDRQGADFLSEYGLPGGVEPPDAHYRNPYHRPISGTCTVGPDMASLPGPGGNSFEFVEPRFHDYDDVSTTCTELSQDPDGLIDSMTDLVRFGLMTFDTLPDPDVGYNSSTYEPDFSDGARGAYSYYVGSPATGRPDGCPDDQAMEVGVRNGAAPAWEGKLINFGNPSSSPTDDTTRHTEVQRVLLSTRPYGATPIAGALDDAYSFLLEDTRPDPLNGTTYHQGDYGPINDPFVVGGCRDQYVILLTDGEPNLDLRPHCEGSPETCPFPKAAIAARNLLSSPRGVKTYVVGFAPDEAEGGTVDCTTMTDADWGPSGICQTAAEGSELHACCTLNEIAFEGGTENAYFSSDVNSLRSDLNEILAEVIGSGRRSATQPVRSPGIGSNQDSSQAVAFRMLTSYEAMGNGLWRGNIERLRFVCDNTGTAVEDDKDQNLGDDFSYNVNKNPDDRFYSTFVPAVTSGIIDASRSLRPVLGAAGEDIDGIGATGGGEMKGGNMTDFVAAVNPLAISPADADVCSDNSLSDSDCRDLLLTWFVGGDNGSDNHRCAIPGSASCVMVGDVQHSTPVIVDHPSAAIDDETYDAFSLQFEKRPMMVYTSSNDGVFHGFKLSPNDPNDAGVSNSDNNELLAFVPPAVLPLIDSQYPSSRQKLLDGVAVIGDVVATENTDPAAYYGYKLERSASSAGVASTTWRTIMVQSFGGANAGFYAVDITEPTVDPTDDTLDGPRLLWQLTTTATGAPLFGQQATTPLITTLNIYDDDEDEGVETAVAILPGGYASPNGTSACARHLTAPWTTIEGGYDPRAKINCYDYDPDNDGYDAGEDLTYAGARSLTIVRLDSGEVIRTFRYDVDEAPAFGLAATTTSRYAGTNGLINTAPLDSPIVGTPAAFPTGLGAVADRIFVGDQDGGLWRVDVSSTDPEDWAMTLFFDTFAKDPNNPAAPDTAALVGQPIVTAPTLSFDDRGQITVLVSTGDQDLDAGTSNYIWSLTERVNATATGFVAGVNWYLPLDQGEHVLGPIELVGEIAYLSTYEPPGTTSVCGNFGTSRVYGMHYLDRDGNTGAPSTGGVAALSVTGDADGDGADQSKTAQELGLPAGTLIFGVTAEFTPSCYDEPGEAPDSVLGGTRRRVQNASQATMQLSFQTGVPTSGKESLGFQSGFGTVSLAPPRATSSIESWAAILE